MISEETVKLFVEDARVQLQLIEASLLLLTLSPTDKEVLKAAKDSVHKVAGAASVFGFKPLAEFLGAMQRLLLQPRFAEDGIDTESMTLLLDVSRHLDVLLELIHTGLPLTGSVYGTGLELRARMEAGMRALETS